MNKKLILIIILIVFIVQKQQAQPGSFAIKITQVYPAGGDPYRNSYNLSGDLDKAENQLRNQYNGKNANYMLELTRPSGKETKYIQNIYWVLSINKKKENRAIKPILEPYYSIPTIIELYSCDIYGKPKSNQENFIFDFYYRFYRGKDTIETIIRKYWTLDDCKKNAQEYFAAHKVDSILCTVKIYNSKGLDTGGAISNQQEYSRYCTMKRSIASQKEQDELRQDSIRKANAKPVYNKQEIETQLKSLQQKVDSLQKGQKNLLQNMQSIIGVADKIAAVLDDSTFARDKYFETADLKDLKAGIKKLLEINKNMTESAMTNKIPHTDSTTNQNKPNTTQNKSQEKSAMQNNKNDIDIQLNILLLKADKLKKGSKDYRQEMSSIIEEADKIVEIIKKENKKFNRNKYFEGELEDLKQGINELIKINNSRK